MMWGGGDGGGDSSSFQDDLAVVFPIPLLSRLRTHWAQACGSKDKWKIKNFIRMMYLILLSWTLNQLYVFGEKLVWDCI